MASAFQHPIKPFRILVKLKCKSEDKAKLEFESIGSVVEHEFRQSECDSYVFMQPREGDRTRILVFEGYDNEAYATKGHRHSDAFKEFREVVSHAGTRQSLEIESYVPKGGYLYRSEVPSIPLRDQLIWIAYLKARPGKRDELISACLTHAGNVHRTEGETLSFVVLEKKDDDQTIVLFERFTNEEYFEKVHRTSDTMKQCREKIAPILEGMHSEGYAAMRGFADKREPVA